MPALMPAPARSASCRPTVRPRSQSCTFQPQNARPDAWTGAGCGRTRMCAGVRAQAPPVLLQCAHGLGAFAPPRATVPVCVTVKPGLPQTVIDYMFFVGGCHPSTTLNAHMFTARHAHYLSLAAPLRAGAARRGLREHRCGDTCAPTCSDRFAVDSRAPPHHRRPPARKPARPPPDARRAEAPNEPQGRASAQMGLVLT